MLNTITIQGRLTKDVELRYTKTTSKPVATFTLACQRSGRDAIADFIDCVAWNVTAQFVDRYFHKGDMAIVTGRLQIRQYEDKTGAKRYATEIAVSDVFFCGDKQARPASAPVDIEPPADFSHQQTFTELPDDEGELPF